MAINPFSRPKTTRSATTGTASPTHMVAERDGDGVTLRFSATEGDRGDIGDNS